LILILLLGERSATQDKFYSAGREKKKLTRRSAKRGALSKIACVKALVDSFKPRETLLDKYQN
jgi:hypothetical protein